MHKYVFLSIIRSNEAESFLRIKKLYLSMWGENVVLNREADDFASLLGGAVPANGAVETTTALNDRVLMLTPQTGKGKPGSPLPP